MSQTEPEQQEEISGVAGVADVAVKSCLDHAVIVPNPDLKGEKSPELSDRHDADESADGEQNESTEEKRGGDLRAPAGNPSGQRGVREDRSPAEHPLQGQLESDRQAG